MLAPISSPPTLYTLADLHVIVHVFAPFASFKAGCVGSSMQRYFLCKI